MSNEKQTGGTEEQKEKTTVVAEGDKKKADKDKKESSSETDSETLKTTDPQENMEGPISSIMQTIKEQGEASDVVTKQEADKKKDENI